MSHRLACTALAGTLCATVLSCTAAPPESRFRVVPERAVKALSAHVTAVPAGKLGAGHRAGCPVPPERLRLIRMNHWGFDGKVHHGELVVHEDVVAPVLRVFEEAFADRFPIRRMRVMATYGGDDAAAMADDNTSAFNCRQVTGDVRRLSRHAWGDAIDINPVENPYVDIHGTSHPPNGRTYLDRSRVRPGMITPDGVVVRAFREVGWYWGGRWSPPDYQHFSQNGG
ncbi:M15 family metallopeptidase [Streptomyces sp. RerS4]|uniref:M15 family metallopeptidase n=1 Tax=Streptomyces sp. RerS4 TaxID=2942449 RepID=UPI00201BA321|nr:M15 family metallopeptidase [Streptomyces sp. RerS4]UQW99557.1 M15 family metallopeptidase [Streptomyces sp. RerS4]